jgi:hypothetical protein
MTKAILASYNLLLNRGQFYQLQPFPKGFRRGKAQDCYGGHVTYLKRIDQ